MAVIQNKNVGTVNIFEFSGSLRDVNAVEADQSIQNILRHKRRTPVFLNASHLESLDKTGLQTLLKTSRVADKCGFLTTDYIWELIVQECYDIDQTMMPLKNIRDAAFFFAKEFAAKPQIEQTWGNERRKFKRLKSILPIELTLDGKFSAKKFFAIATNISEGGILAEFIESDSESEVLFSVDPMDLYFFNMTLWLDPATSMLLKGKLAHSDSANGTIGIEFYGLDSKLRKMIQQFILDDKNFKTLEGIYV